ncbi:MAG: hypothetical protein Q9170_007337, partial [Blastenia crenularia]
MNHLPWPKNEVFPPLEIPYLCSDEPEYDGLGFQDYPLRRGWSTPSNRHEWMHNCSPDTVAVRAQSWLFFGLLNVFLGRRFRRYEYIRLSRATNVWVLNTTVLPGRLAELVRSYGKGTLADELGLPDIQAVREFWNLAFLEAKVESEALTGYLNRSMDMKLMLVGLPISILLLSLQRMADRLFWREDPVPAMCNAGLIPARYSIWQMMESEWCRHQAGHLYNVNSPFLNHYLSGLPRGSASGNHEDCTWKVCVGNNVDEETYEPQHVDEVCSCRHMGPDTRLVTDLISAGRIPLIQISIRLGRPVFDVIAADRDTQYMSISHVWIGGLGNFRDNTLPQCQLLKLYDLLVELERFQPPEPSLQMFPTGTLRNISNIPDKLSSKFAQLKNSSFFQQSYRRISRDSSDGYSARSRPVTFWMDTLCIPVRPEHKTLRTKAIATMAVTYAAASKCLVLDSELSHISMNGLPTTQINAHVLCSGWVRRSWTFQEAKLSRVWYVRFSDGFYNPNSIENAGLEHRLYSDWNTDKSDAHQLGSEAIMWYHDMPPARLVDVYQNQGHRESLHDQTYRFQTVWNNLVARSTSKRDDVHGILANLLDLSASEVLALPVEERMKGILGSQETLSPGVVYSNGIKIRDLANRWVPAFPAAGYLSPSYGQMKKANGGYILDTEKANPVGFLVDKSAPRYGKLRIVCESTGTGQPIWISFDQEEGGPGVDFMAHGDIVAVVYVVGDLKWSIEHRIIGRGTRGARFALRGREGRMLHLAYEYSFAYGHETGESFFDNEDEYPLVSAERTPTDAIFHIDC